MNEGRNLKQRPAGDVGERREGKGRGMEREKARTAWRRSEKPTALAHPGL